MMIKGTKENGKELAICTCDTCSEETKTTAVLGNKPDHVVNLPTVFQKLNKIGWESAGKKLFCKACNEARKSKSKEMIMTTETLRQPTKEQKREILAMLEIAYDADAQRYRGYDSDKSVAESLGKHILWGWVSALREEFFGPDGNEARDEVLKSIKEWQGKANAIADEMRGKLKALDDAISEVSRIASSIEKVKK